MSTTTEGNNSPCISAVMITGKSPERYALARVAVSAFLRQTYTHRRLSIVNHGDEPVMTSELTEALTRVPKGHRVGVSENCLRLKAGMTLGDLRNRALQNIGSGLVVIWDDDDYARHDYMETMYDAWHPGYVVLMQNQIRHDLENNRSCVKTVRSGHVGQSFFELKADRQEMYQSLHKHEDAVLIKEHFGDKIITIRNDPCLYVRNFHGNNVFGSAHILGAAARLARDSHLLTLEQADYVRQVRSYYGR